MNKILLALVSLTLSTVALSTVAHADPITSIDASTNLMDYGIVAGAFAPKPTKVTAGKVTYHVIAPDLIEPACNSTQIVLWVEDENLEGDSGGVAYNLGEQISAVTAVSAKGDELKITYARNNVDDCSTSVLETVYVKYQGEAKPLEIRRD